MSLRKANFFIIGAPRAGTTALSEYLRQHPNVCFSNPKEPSFFATDFEGLRSWVTTEKAYNECFRTLNERHLAIGEGSVDYLYSREAVANILAYNPQSRFIVMLRNPIEAAPSLHERAFRGNMEDVDFWEAWNLQEQRRQGLRLPANCSDARLSVYADIYSYAPQLEKLFSRFSRKQAMIIIFEDFVGDPRTVYEDVLAFLGVPSDGRTYFPRVNEGAKPRFRAVHRLLGLPPVFRALHGSRKVARALLGSRFPDLGQALLRLNYGRDRRSPLAPEQARSLAEYFRDDIDMTGALLGRDLRFWYRKYL